MKLDVQDMVDKVFDRKLFDKFKPVTQYEYKQREGRHAIDTAQLNDEVMKLREALEEEGISVEEKATDEEIITAMLMEEDKFETQMKVNEYNERVTRYKEGSLLERVRIMFNGAPVKPHVIKEEELSEEYDEEEYAFDEDVEEETAEELSEEEIDEINEILGGLSPEKMEELNKQGKSKEAAALAEEVLATMQGLQGA